MNQDSSRTSLSSSAILRIISFLLVLSLLLTAAFYLLNPGKWFLEGRIKDRNARHAQIMTIPQNCIDIYNIGNSLAMVGISPMELWSGQGYTSFNLCRGATTTVQSYFMLKHGFRYQDPDLVMIEASMLFKSDGLLTDLQDAVAEFFYYHFPFARYHNLWKAVGAPPSHREYYMGYLISEHIMPYTGDPDYLKPTDKRKEIEPVPGYFMDRILRLCQKKGKKVLIYSLCSPDCYDTARINALSDYAAAKGVDPDEYQEAEQQALPRVLIQQHRQIIALSSHTKRYGFIAVPLVIIVRYQQHLREEIAPKRNAVRFVAVCDQRYQPGGLHFAAIRRGKRTFRVSFPILCP